MPKRTHSQDPCRPFEGKEVLYQNKAAHAIFVDTERDPGTYAWITPTCETPNCLTVSHLRVHEPVQLAYPRYVCIYCGRSGYTKDHLLPRYWHGNARRRFVAVVPACGTCNSLLGDSLTWSITERRALCHARLRRKHAKHLRVLDRTPAELREYGPNLRRSIKAAMEMKAEILSLLAFPEEGQAFDERALQRSGIEDPYATGLLIADDSEVHEWARRAA